MRYLWVIAVLLVLCVPVLAEDYIVTEAEYVTISGNPSDTLGRTRLTPDSIRIVVTDSAGTELHDAWYEAADAQCALNGNVISFFDQWEDINGAASVGVFSIMATIASDAQNDVDLFSNLNYTLRGLALGVVQRGDSLQAALDSAQAIMAKVLILLDTTQGSKDLLDGTLDVNVASIDANAISSDALSGAAVNEILDSLFGKQLVADTVSGTFLAQLIRVVGAALDTLQLFDGRNALEPDYWSAADSVAYQGSAAGLDSTAVYGAVEQLAADSSLARTGTSQTWNLRGLNIRTAIANDTAVVIHSAGNPGGIGMVIKSDYENALNIEGDTGLFVGGSTTDIDADITGTIVPTDTTAAGKEIAFMPDDWVAADTAGYQGDAAGLDSGTVCGAAQQALEDIGYNSADSTRTGNTVGTITPTDTTESGHSVSYQGHGDYVDTIVVVDTSGTDASVSGVKVTVRDAGGAIQGAPLWTESGEVSVSLNAATYTVTGSLIGYIIPDTTFVVSASGTDTLMGYNISPTAPGSASLCNVFGYILDGNDAPIDGAMITGVRLGDAVAIDTSAANSKIITQTPIPVWSDTTGLFQLYLRKTTEYADTTNGFYLVTCEYGGEKIFQVERLYVPDAATFDIGDTILSRSQ